MFLERAKFNAFLNFEFVNKVLNSFVLLNRGCLVTPRHGDMIESSKTALVGRLPVSIGSPYRSVTPFYTMTDFSNIFNVFSIRKKGSINLMMTSDMKC